MDYETSLLTYPAVPQGRSFPAQSSPIGSQLKRRKWIIVRKLRVFDLHSMRNLSILFSPILPYGWAQVRFSLGRYYAHDSIDTKMRGNVEILVFFFCFFFLRWSLKVIAIIVRRNDTDLLLKLCVFFFYYLFVFFFFRKKVPMELDSTKVKTINASKYR